ncbi:MAG: hypothetical protein E7473_00980 [Ruminococcaceae bacterium]|nr:hypothetical protein [Oscillospiraceae bacterium]
MKKIVSALLVIVMLLGMNTAMANRLPLCSDWAKESIEKANEVGIYNDDGDLTKPISREDFCEVVYNYIKISGKELIVDSTEPFSDTDNEKVAALYNLGIINGKSADKFAPKDTLTREEAATILSRTIDKTWDGKNIEEKHVTFYDYWDISDWAEESIVEMYSFGIINGTGVKENGNVVISPKNKLTAEQAITMVVRLYEKEPKTFTDKMNELMPEDENYMFSPFSIKMALMMAANGAEGETQKEILEALDVSDIEEYNQNTKKMLGTLSEFDILKLEVANSIWINSDNTLQRFSKAFSDKVKEIFGATSDIVNSENALSKINGWVNEKTHGKIPTIITKDHVKDFDAMLINAVYFKARWLNTFYVGATAPDIFTQRDGKTAEIDFMNQTEYMAYSAKDGVTIVKLPYRQYRENYDEDYNVIGTERVDGVDINMYIMMSDDTFNAEKTLDQAELKNTRIKLSVPKFKIEYSASLSGMLKEIGIVKAYDEELAEFKPMVTFEDMWIEDVLHKTYIEIDEEGTEAAAVTAVGMGGSGSAKPPEPIELKFNKPFTFVIRDDVSGEILFMGEYAFAE